MLRHIHSGFVCLCVAAATLSTAATSRALDPNLPPSGNFDLTAWKVTLPDQTEIKEQELSGGFESTDEFYTDLVTGGMVFKCPNDGQTGGSTYPRCELREMLRAGNTSISTTGIGLNNWVFSSSSPANQQASGGVDGTMTATLTVDHVSTTGSSSKVGRVVVGQIHASSDEPCRVYYRKLPGNSKGSIYFAHEPTSGSEQWYEMIGSRSDSASDPADGISLGEEWSYEIQAIGNTLTVTIMRAGKPDVVEIVDMSGSGFADDWMYFKAGCYNQNNEGGGSQFAQVTFYSLTHTHNGFGNQPPSFTTDPINEINATEDAVYGSTIADNASDLESDPMTFSKVSGPAWLSVATNGTLSGTPGAGDAGQNVFTVQVDATGGSDTATLNITVDPTGDWVELANDDFEGGWGNYTDGGSDALLSSDHAIGTQCVNLQDNTSTSVATLTNPLDLTGYSELRIDFSYVVQSFEDSEDFWVQYSDNGGSTWTTVKSYINDVDFVDNGTRYNPILIFDDATYNFTGNAKIRFRCDASANGDDVYIDNVVLFGELSGMSNQPPAFTTDPVDEIDAVENAAYNSSLADNASDPESDPMSFSKISGPAWLNVATNGVLSGTPGAGDVGANVFTVQVDAVGGSDAATLNIAVNAETPGGTGTNVVVDDSFVDADRANTGPLQADWYSSTSNGGNSIEVYPGQLGLVSGTSGRGNHGIFASQPLSIGDTLIATLTFTTPATVGINVGAALRFGLFDTTGHLPGLEADLTASSGSPNSNYNNLNGYMMDLDVATGSEDLTMRERDNAGSGRLLSTTGDYAELGSGGNNYTFLANTSYTVEFSVRRQSAGEVQLTGSLYQGLALLSTHTESDLSATATEFGMLGMHANSSTFGSTTSHGISEDNGITFSNIKVEFVTTAVSPPALDITLSGADVVLSWPTQDTAGFTLESKSDWSAPSWSPEGSPTVVGDQNQVTIPANGGSTYFRLKKP